MDHFITPMKAVELLQLSNTVVHTTDSLCSCELVCKLKPLGDLSCGNDKVGFLKDPGDAIERGFLCKGHLHQTVAKKIHARKGLSS